MNKKYICSLIIFLCCIVSTVFAQNAASSDVYRRIDGAIKMEKVDVLTKILQEYKGKTEYQEIESYILKSSRELLIQNQLDLASSITLALVDNNLDNFEAVNLYSSIEKAIAKREAQLAAQKEQEQIALLKKQEQTEKNKDRINKEFKVLTNLKTGETIYLDSDTNTRYSKHSWGFYLGFINAAFLIDAQDLSIKYGTSVDANFVYQGEKVALGLEALGDIMFIGFSGQQGTATNFNTTALFAINRLSKNFFFRLGGTGTISRFYDAENIKGYLPEYFIGPTFGFGFKDIRIKKSFLNTSLDYNFAHLFHPNVYTSLNFALNFLLPVAELNSMNVCLNVGLRDGIAFTKTGLYNQAKIVLSFGVYRNE